MNVQMEKDGKVADVNAGPSVAVMEKQGWTVVGGTGGDAKPSDGLTVAELKDALTAKGIAIPEGAKKPELAALLDA